VFSLSIQANGSNEDSVSEPPRKKVKSSSSVLKAFFDDDDDEENGEEEVTYSLKNKISDEVRRYRAKPTIGKDKDPLAFWRSAIDLPMLQNAARASL
jgi:hypothetical protein